MFYKQPNELPTGGASERKEDSMTLRGTRVAVFVMSALVVAPAVIAAQPDGHDPGPLPKSVSEPISLYKVGLGPFSRKISSANSEAQAFFDQGFQMMYAFAKLDAVRSFREAWKRDPACAICYWGEGWAWGSYLNGPMSAEQAPFAYAATQKALSLKDKATPIERAFIEALAVRYVKDFDATTRIEQDKAYAEAMRRVYEAHPADLDAGTLYADALFLLEPRRGTRDVHAPNVMRLHAVLESVLARDDRHPGACHLYVHATESTIKPEKAEACAEYLGKTIPGASHINHMPSHTFNEVGRWGDSVRANLEAWHSDLKADAGEGFAIYPDHNLHMLLYAASMDGQGAIAMQAGKDYAKRTNDTMYHVLTLVRFGRFDEVREITTRPERDVPAAAWDFAQGYAHLRKGEADFAKAYLGRIQKTAESSNAEFRNHPAKRLVGVLAGILAGEIARQASDLPAAIAAFERAVVLDDELEYDEPEPLPFPARHWLGAALLEASRFAEAERTYRDDLKDHPHNGWSLVGLQQALKAQGKAAPEVDADLAASWSRSDTWIRSSRFD
ncbi:MAG: tetratricopeptide repeat protein [Vicinamibacterales bacterium]